MRRQGGDRHDTTRKDAAGVLLYTAEKATWMTLGDPNLGHGYINESPTGRLLRDAKPMKSVPVRVRFDEC